MNATERREANAKMKSLLEGLGLPFKEIQVYGTVQGNVVITSRGEDTAEKWAQVLAKFCTTVKGPIESVDYNKVNKKSVMNPSRHRVWRTFGYITA